MTGPLRPVGGAMGSILLLVIHVSLWSTTLSCTTLEGSTFCTAVTATGTEALHTCLAASMHPYNLHFPHLLQQMKDSGFL